MVWTTCCSRSFLITLVEPDGNSAWHGVLEFVLEVGSTSWIENTGGESLNKVFNYVGVLLE